jgi:hypothetical protein
MTEIDIARESRAWRGVANVCAPFTSGQESRKEQDGSVGEERLPFHDEVGLVGDLRAELPLKRIWTVATQEAK